MTVGQLKKELEKYPDDTEVFIDERKTEFTYGMLNGVRDQEITLKEDPDDEEHIAIINAVILSEE